MATITENINRIKQAKADIKEAIIAKGVAVEDDARIDGYAEKIGEIQQGGGQFAIDYGEEIYTNNAYSMTAEQEDIDYYNEVVRSIESGEKTEEDYWSGELAAEFRQRIAFLPKGFTLKNKVNFLIGFINLREIYMPDEVLYYYPNGYFTRCTALKSVKMNFDSVTTFPLTFNSCSALREFVASCNSLNALQQTFTNCYSLRTIELVSPKLINIGNAFTSCISLRKLHIGGVISVASGAFTSCSSLQDVEISVAVNTDFSASSVLSHKSIAYILSHANGTITLTFNKTAIAGFSDSEESLDGKTYSQIYAESIQNGITIAEK